MKKTFKMLSLICVLTLTVAAFSVLATAATAPSYDEGDIMEVSAKAESFLVLETHEEKVALAKELNAYLFTNVVGIRYSQAVFAKIYGEQRCDVCEGDRYACDDCAGKMTPYAQYRYERYQTLVNKIMAYGAVALIDSYDASAHNYEQRALSSWVSRFIEYDIENYTRSEVLADDFFDEFSSDAYTVVAIEVDTENGTAVYTVKVLNPDKEAVEVAVSEILDASLINEIQSVEINGVTAADSDWSYDADGGVLSLAKINVTAADFVLNAETGSAEVIEGEAVIKLSATVKEGYVAPGEAAPAPKAEANLGELANELINKVDAVLAASLDKLSDAALDEYVYDTIHFNPDFRTNYTKYLANYANAIWYGTMYENYRIGDVMPKYNYSLSGNTMAPVVAGTGEYDVLKKGDYVIFDDDVETYYVKTSKGLVEVEAKRNYVYNEVDGGYVDVGVGKGIYDLYDYEYDGYGKLLSPEYFLHVDMTGSPLTSSRPYLNMSGSNTGGIVQMVMQTDITHFTTKGHLAFMPYVYYNNGQSYAAATTITVENGHIYMPKGVDANGNSYTQDGKYILKDVIVPGKWTNLAVVLNVPKGVLDIYVDYEYVYSATITLSGVTSYYSVRAQVYGDTTGIGRSCAFKNSIVYQGTAPRDLTKFEYMSLAEKFAYYGECILNEENAAPSRLYAYSQMQFDLPGYFAPDEDFEGSHVGVDEDGNPILVGGTIKTLDENVIKAIIQYYSFDYHVILTKYKTENAAKYAVAIKQLTDVQRRYSTIATRNQAVKDIAKFLAPYQDVEGNPIYIDTDSDVYKEAKAKYDKAVEQLAADEASFKFVDLMEKYANTVIYTKKTSYYEQATELVRTVIFDETITNAGETRLAAAYATYGVCAEELAAMIYKQNSKYLVMYIDYTTSFDTVESWETNYNHLNYPISKAREIIKTGKYDINYTEGEEGTDSYKSLRTLLEWYELINDYFFAALQQEHIDYIVELQNKYTETESYMEKLGICSEIERYVASADLDLNNAQIQILLEKNKEYLAEVDGLEASYITQRNKRTELFVSTIRKLDVAEGYNEMKTLVDEAVGYFYSMTVGATDVVSDEVITEALNKYNYYIEYVEKIAETSEDFKILAAGLENAASLSQRYSILAEATAMLDLVSEDIAGVSAAYAQYQAAYNGYMAIAAPANAEIAEAQSTVISLRSGYCVSAVLAAFAELIGSIVD